MDAVHQQTQGPQIREVFEAAIPEILQIADKELGNGYLSESDLTNPSGITYFSTEANVVTGFAFNRTVGTKEFLAVHPKLAERLNEARYETESFGLLSAVVVKDYYQGKGIGTALTRKSLQWLEATGAPYALMTAWKGVSGIHIAKVARRTGFSGQFEVQEYWAEDSIHKGYRCPDCGDPPCHCSAAVYIHHFLR